MQKQTKEYTNSITFNLTNEEAIDFSKICSVRDKSPADQVHNVVKTYLYGHTVTQLNEQSIELEEEPLLHNLSLTLSTRDFNNLTKLGIIKNNSLSEQLAEAVADYLYGHCRRLN